MKIEIESIESKLREPSLAKYSSQIIDAVEHFVNVIKEFESSGKARELYATTDNWAEDKINSHALALSSSFEDEEVCAVIDALRHAFTCFAYNGLHQLYTRQENEAWFPKVVLKEVLVPNDIFKLDQEITLYRGSCVSEFESSQYGQAWTTSLSVANAFAYEHYQSQDWFDRSNRIVMVAKYLRENVLFSHQSVEFEVVVDTTKLSDVKLYT
ncbi:hypothetical protein [Vibrio sp. MACH09]|uniref:hypothetical protein n=1 Tax=Vibrio sp. MACH09 TaxID=3025122 RepID=UPI00295EC906|nr:hypothetical protein [Vibrio sp. MACH09]